MADDDDVPIGRDPIALAALAALVIVGIVVMVDLIQDGEVSASILALFLAMMGPLVPAMIARSRRR